MGLDKSRISTKTITSSAVIAAFYTVLCFAFAPISYGVVQIRIAEALTLLSMFSPVMGIGITAGCALSNAIGFAMGTNPMIFDVFFGTLATGISAFFTWKLRNFRIGRYPLFSALPPVLINAVMIGAEITVLETGSLFKMPKLLLLNSTYVGLGQVIPCMIIGPLLIMFLERTGIAEKWMK